MKPEELYELGMALAILLTSKNGIEFDHNLTGDRHDLFIICKLRDILHEYNERTNKLHPAEEVLTELENIYYGDYKGGSQTN